MNRLNHELFDQLDVTAVLGDCWAKYDWSFIEKDTDTYTDSSWRGCDYRYQSGAGLSANIACNLTITGRKSKILSTGNYSTRVSIEIVGDGEPSEFFGGIIYHKNPLFKGILKCN